VLQSFLVAVAAGDAVVPIDHVYRFDQIVEAHTVMDAGDASGMLVIST
jgi:NADPH2:quinone reductase